MHTRVSHSKETGITPPYHTPIPRSCPSPAFYRAVVYVSAYNQPRNGACPPRGAVFCATAAFDCYCGCSAFLGFRIVCLVLLLLVLCLGVMALVVAAPALPCPPCLLSCCPLFSSPPPPLPFLPLLPSLARPLQGIPTTICIAPVAPGLAS